MSYGKSVSPGQNIAGIAQIFSVVSLQPLGFQLVGRHPNSLMALNQEEQGVQYLEMIGCFIKLKHRLSTFTGKPQIFGKYLNAKKRLIGKQIFTKILRIFKFSRINKCGSLQHTISLLPKYFSFSSAEYY